MLVVTLCGFSSSPPPSSLCTTGHVIYNLNGMTVLEPCVYVERGEGLGRGKENKTMKYCGAPSVHTSSALSLCSALLGELGDSGSTWSGLFYGGSVSTAGGNFCERGDNGRKALWKMWAFFKSNLIKSNWISVAHFPTLQKVLLTFY